MACLLTRCAQEMGTPNIVFASPEDVIYTAADWRGYASEGGVKLVGLIKREPGLSWVDWSEAWRDVGALYKRLAPALQIKRYVQTRCYHSEAAEIMRKHRDWPQNPFDGLVEIWFDSYPAMLSALSSDKGQAAAAEIAVANADVQGDCIVWMTPERMIFDKKTLA
jgi:hypothetical protein